MNARPSTANAVVRQTSVYSTDSLHFSAWLITDNLLSYQNAEKVGRKVWFFFSDPEGRGPGLNAQWQASNPLVPQKTILEVVRMLRTEMTALQTPSGVR